MVLNGNFFLWVGTGLWVGGVYLCMEPVSCWQSWRSCVCILRCEITPGFAPCGSALLRAGLQVCPCAEQTQIQFPIAIWGGVGPSGSFSPADPMICSLNPARHGGCRAFFPSLRSSFGFMAAPGPGWVLRDQPSPPPGSAELSQPCHLSRDWPGCPSSTPAVSWGQVC